MINLVDILKRKSSPHTKLIIVIQDKLESNNELKRALNYLTNNQLVQIATTDQPTLITTPQFNHNLHILLIKKEQISAISNTLQIGKLKNEDKILVITEDKDLYQTINKKCHPFSTEQIIP